MQKGVAAHNGLVQRRGLTDDGIDGLAGTVDLGGVQPGLIGEEAGTGAHGHDHFLQRGVAGPLAQSVDRALDLPRAAHDAGQGVGHRHAQVIVAVHRILHLV